VCSVCKALGHTFNPAKCQCLTFGGNCSTLFRITLDDVELKRIDKLKYLGCHFYESSGRIHISYRISKFYSNFNNVMSVVGYYINETVTLHLIESSVE